MELGQGGQHTVVDRPTLGGDADCQHFVTWLLDDPIPGSVQNMMGKIGVHAVPNDPCDRTPGIAVSYTHLTLPTNREV